MSKKKIIIIGGSGSIGSSIANEIIKDGDKAKLRAYIVKLKKEEMMERYARK